MYPVIMAPAFRHGTDTPWGGSMLRDLLGKEAPDETTGESLEVSALEGLESIATNGPQAGMTLPGLIRLWGRDLTGAEEGPFPLLIKLIDAAGRLSVQVHPDDAYAAANEGGKLGKTEAWVVLSCEEGAQLAYGVKETPEPLSELVAQQRTEEALNWLKVRPGDVLYIPAGMVHALGDGILVYEVQQSSDVTYRFWDWGRVGKDGKPRALHTRQALDVTRVGVIPEKCKGATVLTHGGSVTYFIENEYFELARLNLSGAMPLPAGRMRLITPLCPCTVTWPEGSAEVAPFQTVVIPAALEGAVIEGTGNALMSCPSDRDALRKELGYRASDVMGLE